MAKKKKPSAQEKAAESGNFGEVTTAKEAAKPKQKKNKKS